MEGEERKGQAISSCRLETLSILSQMVDHPAKCSFHKKARAMCYDADLCNPVTCTEEAEMEAIVKDICGSLAESFVNEKNN